MLVPLLVTVENSISSEDESEPLEIPYATRVARASKKKFSARGLKCKVLRLLHRGGKETIGCDLEKVYPGDKVDGEKNGGHLGESGDDDDYAWMTRSKK